MNCISTRNLLHRCAEVGELPNLSVSALSILELHYMFKDYVSPFLFKGHHLTTCGCTNVCSGDAMGKFGGLSIMCS